MPPEVLKLLKDMLEAAADITDFAAAQTFETYQADKKLRRAVERSFEIVGEALSQLQKISPETARKISDWRAIIGFRNVLIHGYGQVDDAKTWDIIQSEIPILRDDLLRLLNPGAADRSQS